VIQLSFANVVSGVAQLAGLDRDALPSHFFKAVRDLSDHRLGMAWDSEYWPELIRIASATVSQTSNAAPYFYNLPDTYGEVLDVYDKNPEATTQTAPIAWKYGHDGTNRRIILRSSTTPVYVEYRISKPSITQDSTGDIDSQTAIPKIFQGYLIRSVFADYLKANGQVEQAMIEDANAESLLQLEADKVYRQAGQIRSVNMFTY
jgi:hypothetical protein